MLLLKFVIRTIIIRSLFMVDVVEIKSMIRGPDPPPHDGRVHHCFEEDVGVNWHNCANIVVPDTPTRHQTDPWPYHDHGVVVVLLLHRQMNQQPLWLEPLLLLLLLLHRQKTVDYCAFHCTDKGTTGSIIHCKYTVYQRVKIRQQQLRCVAKLQNHRYSVLISPSGSPVTTSSYRTQKSVSSQAALAHKFTRRLSS